jgi:hypothetical protein
LLQARDAFQINVRLHIPHHFTGADSQASRLHGAKATVGNGGGRLALRVGPAACMRFRSPDLRKGRCLFFRMDVRSVRASFRRVSTRSDTSAFTQPLRSSRRPARASVAWHHAAHRLPGANASDISPAATSGSARVAATLSSCNRSPSHERHRRTPHDLRLLHRTHHIDQHPRTGRV